MHGQHHTSLLLLTTTTISFAFSFLIAMMAFSAFFSGRTGEENHHHQHRRFNHGKKHHRSATTAKGGGLFCFNRPEMCLCITRYPRCFVLFSFFFAFSTTTHNADKISHKNAGTRECRSSLFTSTNRFFCLACASLCRHLILEYLLHVSSPYMCLSLRCQKYLGYTYLHTHVKSRDLPTELLQP